MKFIPNAVSVKVALTLLKTQKHAPTLMFGAGVAGVVATAVLASKATLKGVTILADHKEDKESLESIVESEHYTHQDLVKDKALLAYQTSLKFTKLYAPTIVVGAISVSLLTGSHVMLTKRNASLTAAYAAIDKAYREYRDRVRDHVGTDRERDLYRNVKTEKVTVVGEDGKKKQVEKKVSHGGGAGYSYFYSEVFENGELNPNWQELPEMNTLQLRILQNQFTRQLQSRGYLFLGDVLKEMGIPRTGEFGKMSQQVGWLTVENGGQDGFVDFGVFADQDLEKLLDFSTGRIDGLWLDFNVDGTILDKI